MNSKSIENNPKEQTVFPEDSIHPTIDIIKSLEKGEFNPFIIALLHDYISIDFLNPEGYNILHQATAFNAKEIVYLLVERIKNPLDILSHTKQTPLMIAANFGFIELIKYFIDKGASLTLTDECNFSPLLYAIKQGELTSVFYLLHKGSYISIKDNNGCDVVHWAAYKNSLFLLRFFKRLNLPLNECDFHGFRPIDRAIANSSFESVKFLWENCSKKDLNLMNYKEIKNEEIREYLMEKVQAGNKRKEKIKKTFEKYRKTIVFGGYLFWMFSMILSLSNNLKYYDHYYSIITILGLWVYLLCFVSFFLQRENNDKNTVFFNEKDEFYGFIQNISNEQMNLYSFFHLDHLIPSTNLSDPNQYTIIHYIAYLIESYQFLTVLDLDYNRVCPTCLIYKPPKTKHCSICDKCVSFYHHHSIIFHRCFDSKNHVFYFGLLVLQGVLCSFFIKIVVSSYYDDCTSWIFIIIAEITYIICKETSLVWGVNFLFNFVIWCFNTGIFVIEAYGILKNLTFNEIINRQRYRYLFQKKNDKNGKILYVFEKSCCFKDIIKNINNYCKRCFS